MYNFYTHFKMVHLFINVWITEVYKVLEKNN